MTVQWYALRSKPNREESLWREAKARGFNVFFPRSRVHTVNPRARQVLPYFPGYMFVNTDIQTTGFSAFAWMPYSNGLVSFGSEPAPVPESLIHAIRRRVEEINARGRGSGRAATRRDGQHPGGAVCGTQAIFDGRLSGSDRVRVLLQLISRQQVALDLPTAYIQRAKRR